MIAQWMAGGWVAAQATKPGNSAATYCLAGIGVTRHPLDCLAERQLTLTGIYRWL